jgi:hypothetical protein
VDIQPYRYGGPIGEILATPHPSLRNAGLQLPLATTPQEYQFHPRFHKLVLVLGVSRGHAWIESFVLSKPRSLNEIARTSWVENCKTEAGPDRISRRLKDGKFISAALKPGIGTDGTVYQVHVTIELEGKPRRRSPVASS